jgi:hypothetical protein
MRILFLSLILMSGCTSFSEHDARKQALQQEIEILQLEKRKALLQRQVEFIENSDLIPVFPSDGPH